MAYYWQMFQLKNVTQLISFMNEESHYIGICFSLVDRYEFESIKQIWNLLINLNTLTPQTTPKIVLVGLRSAVRDHIVISQTTDRDSMNIYSGYWINIPDELFLYVIKFLDRNDLISIGCTCKRFFLLVFDSLFPGLNFEGMDIITSQDIEDIKRDLNAIYSCSNHQIIYRELKKNSNPLTLINFGNYPHDKKIL